MNVLEGKLHTLASVSRLELSEREDQIAGIALELTK